MSQLAEQLSKIAVLGLGKEGLDLLHFLRKLDINSVGLDEKSLVPTDRRYLEFKHLTHELRLGKHYLDNLGDFDLVFRSPGVSLDLLPIKRARRRGVRFSSPIQLFFDLCPALIVGITGTKGKSTTTSLIYHLLKGRSSGKVYMGGNIGYPPLNLLPKLTKKDVVVLELSSFQLEDMTKSPHIAVVLDVVPEHLNRHRTFKSYLAAKMNIVHHQTKNDWAIVSSDHKISSTIALSIRGKKVRYSTRKVLPRGLYIADGEIIHRDIKTGHRYPVMPVSEISLPGKHNLGNVLAAIAVALLLGVKPEKIRRRLKKFITLEHRLELVGEKKGIKFINDSLATTPVATLAALETVAGPLTLILGGASKKEDFRGLVNSLEHYPVQGVILIGETAKKIHQLLKAAKVKFPVSQAKDFSAAVQQAYHYAEPRGTVLFSPACASFGWFTDAYDRGQQFKSLVNKIIHS
ncbi:MAG: UDP-N-acetylmuramoyl-L-alanine--D-glutamate ligase [Patescibacteria group bacterium]